MRKIIAFDCDGTLEISKGPVPLNTLKILQSQGWRVGICGNWELAKKHIDSLDFYRGAPKAQNLAGEGRGFQVKIFVADAAPDEEAAKEGGWRLVYAKDFRLEDIIGND